MTSFQADELQRGTIASFGTAGSSSPLLLPYVFPSQQQGTSTSAATGSVATAFRHLRSLDSMLGGAIGVSSQLVPNTPRFVRMSINVEPDLVGLQGFACEQEPQVSRTLTAR